MYITTVYLFEVFVHPALDFSASVYTTITLIIYIV